MKKMLITALCAFMSAAALNAQRTVIEFKTAKFQFGDDPAWSSPKLDDSAWTEIATNKDWAGQGINRENTYAWYRVHFKLDKSLRKLPRGTKAILRTGYADDAQTSWLNGKPVGSVNGHTKPGAFVVDLADLKPGEDNVIAVRVRNDGGEGGISWNESSHVPNPFSIEIPADMNAEYSSLMEKLAAQASAVSINGKFATDRYAAANAAIGLPKPGEWRVVFMGDSITDGWPRTRPEFFSSNGFIGRGIGGQTSYQYLLRFQNDVIELKPDVVVINYGTNDIAENTGKYDEEQTFRNVKAMCEMAAANGIRVVLASTLPHGGFPWNPSITDAMPKILSLNAKVREYAELNGISYVDWFAEMVSADGTRMRDGLSKDGVHPNSDGYAIMERIVLPYVRK